uniref:type IV pilin protein n=1 Tax=Dialister sp. TaxID=1955814 RepID=UPI00402816ED
MNETISPVTSQQGGPMEKEKRTIKKRKGFMLLELIIVVAINGILAAIAIRTLVGRTADAKVAK